MANSILTAPAGEAIVSVERVFDAPRSLTRLTASFHAAQVEQRDDIVRRGVARNVTQGNEKLAAYLTAL